MSGTIKWEIIKDKSHEHRVEFQGTTGGRIYKGFEDKEGTPIWNYHASCKFDGCVEFTSYSNGYSWDHTCTENCQCCAQAIHICSLSEHLFELGVLLEEAKHYFKDKPAGYEYWFEEDKEDE